MLVPHGGRMLYMSLYEKLKEAKSEEDVKDVYIKAIGLKDYQKNLIDIQTKEVWFEAKTGSKVSTYEMFTQLLHYVQEALNKGEYIPPFLCVIDQEKAAIMKTSDALPLLENKNTKIKWGKSASDVTQEALEIVSTYIGTYIVSYKISTHESEFMDAIKGAIKNNEIIRTQITPDNLKQVFDKWVEMIGKEIKDVLPEDYNLLFFADIMHDGSVATHHNLPAALIYKDGNPAFFLRDKLCELGNKEGYRKFWQIYHKPPKAEHRDYLLERRDTLIPVDERSFKGAFYTPLHVVDKAYDKLTETLGVNWQKEYIVWDMCCGVGNLEVKHSNPRNIFMSTLDQADVDVMKATKTCVAATRFQYDYLNDDITEDGKIDYSLTNKIPEQLRKAIAENKKILVLINPPYAEATNADNTSKSEGAKNKSGVAKTKVGGLTMDKYGKASNELFTQFVVRVAKEIPNATLAMFSKMKYVNAPNFEEFRKHWDADYLGGFIVHSKSFEGLKGNFPIGFLVWQTSHGDGTLSQIGEITTDILDKNAKPIGEKKFYNIPNDKFLNVWIKRSRANKTESLPLVNATDVATGKAWVKNWSDDAIGYMCSGTNDLQNATKYTFLLSSQASRGHGFYVNKKNLEKACVLFVVQKVIKPTWINDRDQFLQPDKELLEEFKNDCLMWTLFNGSNLTASANDLEWDGRKWSIVNHFIPFTEGEVGAPERFESNFMVEYMSGKKFSKEAEQVLEEGRKLWQKYFSETDNHTIREELKLNRVDVGWYQVRNALKKRSENGDGPNISFENFEEAYKTLTEKLRPQVYELGFLKK